MRDEFTEAVKRALAHRAGWTCSNPMCSQPTSGPSESSKGVTNVGVAAHISAASPLGPRFDPAQSRSERGAITNGLWLCQKCAKAVDDDPVTYGRALLRDWKREAEARARRAIEAGPVSAPSVRAPSILRVLTHRAFFVRRPEEHFFVKIVNLNPVADVEVTHVWYESARRRVDILSRVLPVRLKQSEMWETYIRVDALPADEDGFGNFRVLLSTGEVFNSARNISVPPRGYVAGR